MSKPELVLTWKRKMEDVEEQRGTKDARKSDLEFFVKYRPWESFMKGFLTPLDLYMLRSTCRMLRAIIRKKPITCRGIVSKEIHHSPVMAWKEGNFFLSEFLMNKYQLREWRHSLIMAHLPRTERDLEIQMTRSHEMAYNYVAEKGLETENLDFLLRWNDSDGISHLGELMSRIRTHRETMFARKLVSTSLSADGPIAKLIEQIDSKGIFKLGSLEIFREWEKKNGSRPIDVIWIRLGCCVPFGCIDLIQHLLKKYPYCDRFNLAKRAVTHKRHDVLKLIVDEHSTFEMRLTTLNPRDAKTATLLLEWKHKNPSVPRVGFDWNEVQDLEFAKFICENKLLEPGSCAFEVEPYNRELSAYYMERGFPDAEYTLDVAISNDDPDLFQYARRYDNLTFKERMDHLLNRGAWKILERIKTSCDPSLNQQFGSWIETLKEDVQPLVNLSPPFVDLHIQLRWYKDNVGPKIPDKDIMKVFRTVRSTSHASNELFQMLIQDEMLGMEIWNSETMRTKYSWDISYVLYKVIGTGNLSWIKKVALAGSDVHLENDALSKAAKMDSVEILDYFIQELGHTPTPEIFGTAILSNSPNVFRRLLELDVPIPKPSDMIDLATEYCQPEMVESLKTKFQNKMKKTESTTKVKRSL